MVDLAAVLPRCAVVREKGRIWGVLRFVLLASGIAANADAAIPASERAALLEVFNATNGPNWSFSDWGREVGTECRWYGVYCDNARTTVTGIFLDDNNLVGTLPSLNGLPNLEALGLSNGKLTGSIPPLTELKKLQYIGLDNNQLTGSIPALTGLADITGLSLSHNQLSGPIPSFAGLTKLDSVFLHDNRLTGSIPALSGLVGLITLALSDNQLTGPIPPLTGLSSLQNIYASDNQFTGTIPSLAELNSLGVLLLNNNQLSGSIPSLAGLTKLQALWLDHNMLTGTIPPLSASPILQSLKLHNNQLNGSIPSLSGLVWLQDLFLANNLFTGSIPALTDLKSLLNLSLSNNWLTGTLPSFNGLPSLATVLLDNNQLTGAIPQAPATLTPGKSNLCPNNVIRSTDVAWDLATGVVPWSRDCVPPPPVPKINTGGVVGLNNVANRIQPGSWISIYGVDLATTTAVWQSDFPTILGGTSVTLNGKHGYLWSVSPGQINLQAPDDETLGPVEVKVTTPTGTATSTVTLVSTSPSFNLLDGKHIAGIILRFDGTGSNGGGTYDILGPTGASLGYRTVAAKAHDSVLLFGIGFGATTPPVAAGKAFSGAAPTANTVQFTINGLPLTPDWSGISAAGLFQFNLTIPSGLGTGDLTIKATVNGVDTPVGVVVSLE
ncbi:MAG: hypothetical protein ABI824_19815 [Acidobacteriota bacterium]